MSLSSSLNIAVAGLDLSSRRADVVARNVANADRAGYARRSIDMGGPGVGVPGSFVTISRDSDPRLVLMRREAQSRQAGEEVLQSFYARLDSGIGDPDQSGSLSDQIARLDAAFVTAAADPRSVVGMTEIANAATDLVALINTLDDIIQDERQSADTDIGRVVAQLNSDLADVARLNTDIRRLSSGGNDAADLQDQRALLIDRISAQVPVRELARDDGAVAIVSKGGLLLLDGRPATLGFDTRAPITAEMSAPTQLSGLRVNGRDVGTTGTPSGIPGGALEALFKIRDDVAPQATSRLDGLAADLIERFEAADVDTTRMVGDAGLFTDRGTVIAAVPDPGLAGRLEVNERILPDAGGDLWRLRDGLGAIAEGTGVDASLILRYGATLSKQAQPSSGGLPGITASLAGHAASLKSIVSSERLAMDDRVAFSMISTDGLAAGRDGGQVDIDTEMRRLVEIEQAYAANARIVQAVSDMMNRLTEI